MAGRADPWADVPVPSKPTQQTPASAAPASKINYKNMTLSTDKPKNTQENSSTTIPTVEIKGDSSALNNSAGVSLPDVVVMQKALIDAADTIASHPIAADTKTEDPKAGTLDGGDSFTKFLVNNYIAPTGAADKKQYVNTQVAQPVRDQAGAKKDDSFRGILQSIKQLGSGIQGKETEPDGLWGAKTDNALKQIYALAAGLLKMEKDMGLDHAGTVYDDTKLQALAKSVAAPGKTMNDAQRVQAAKAITPQIADFKNFYNWFSEQLSKDKSALSMITQTAPVYTKENRAQNHAQLLNKDDQAIYEQVKGQAIPIELQGRRMTITPADLESATSFKAWLGKPGSLPEGQTVDKLDPASIGSIAAQIAAQVTG